MSTELRRAKTTASSTSGSFAPQTKAETDAPLEPEPGPTRTVRQIAVEEFGMPIEHTGLLGEYFDASHYGLTVPDEQGKRYAEWVQRYLHLDDVVAESALPALRRTLEAKVAQVRADAAEDAGRAMARYDNVSKTYSIVRYGDDGMTEEPVQDGVDPKDVMSVLDALNGPPPQTTAKDTTRDTSEEHFWSRDPDQDPTGGVWR